MRKLLTILAANILFILFTINLNAQITVNLKLDESEKVSFLRWLFCDKDYNCGLFQNEESKTDVFGQEKIPIKVRRAGTDFYFQIGENQNVNLAEAKEVLLKSGSSIKVRIKRQKTGETIDLPYEISHNISEKNGQTFDDFTIAQYYKGLGQLNYKNCSYKVALTDMNYDGLFNLSDADGGTNFGIDINNDGKFWGKAEHRKINEIIEICGQNFLAQSLDKNILVFNPTDLKIARIGQKVPSFSFDLLNGKKISSEDLAGKYFVFDFWASWCAPCVGQLSIMATIEKANKNKLSVFSINVDESERRNQADKIIQEKQLFDYSTIRGLGDNDPLWKTFGSESTRLSIPLYVLVDNNGTVVYSGSGGENLKELKDKIAEINIKE